MLRQFPKPKPGVKKLDLEVLELGDETMIIDNTTGESVGHYNYRITLITSVLYLRDHMKLFLINAVKRHTKSEPVGTDVHLVRDDKASKITDFEVTTCTVQPLHKIQQMISALTAELNKNNFDVDTTYNSPVLRRRSSSLSVSSGTSSPRKEPFSPRSPEL